VTVASNRFDITMLGVPELSKALAALPEKVEQKVMRQALRQAGKYYLMLAKARAPRETGRLSSTMKLRAMKRRKGRVGVMIQTGTRAQLGIDPKRKGYYPAHTEFGHLDRSGVHQPANPYMRTSLKTSESAIFAILRQELDAGIEREMRGSA
jgi:HK97 gp10 family phage protein